MVSTPALDNQYYSNLSKVSTLGRELQPVIGLLTGLARGHTSHATVLMLAPTA